MFDYYRCSLASYIDDQGNVQIGSAPNILSDYIEVKPNTKYIVSANTSVAYIRIHEFTSNKTWFKRTPGNNVSSLEITTDATTKYIRVTYNLNGSTTMTQAVLLTIEAQIEEGASTTTYSPYQNLDGQEYYSTEEIRIGTWMGKPLYRKVIDCGNLPNNDTKTVAHGISNIERTIKCFGSAKYGAYFLDLPYLAISSGSISGANSIGVTADATNINLITGTNRTSWSTYIVLEYTKTTD